MSTSPINAAKGMQGFVSAFSRKRCGICQHFAKLDQDTAQCRKGGFFVAAYAVCILAEPKEVAGVKGIKVVTGVEDFVITPFEVSVGEAA